MSNRIVATAAASALAAYASLAAAIVACPAAVAAEPAPVEATRPADGSVWGRGSVGAMHFEVGSIATDAKGVVSQSKGLVTAVPAIFAPSSGS